MPKIRIQFSGQTTDGMWVMKDVFKLKDTYGIPLVVVAEVMKANNVRVPWLDLVADMRSQGVREDTIRQEISDMAEVLYDDEGRSIILQRLGFKA